MKLRRMIWLEHIAYKGKRQGAYRALVGRHRERDRLEDLGINRKIILKWISKKWDRAHGLDLSGLG
jgi:hypothetical protein